jgi:hypothetical protein
MKPGGGVVAREIAHMNAGGSVVAREIAHGYAQRPGPDDLALGLGPPEEFTLCCLFDILKSFHWPKPNIPPGPVYMGQFNVTV